MTHILTVQSSARYDGSHSRALSQKLIDQLLTAYPEATVTERDAANNLPLIDEQWLGANWTPADQREAEQTQALELSDTLIGELEKADIVVIGAPMYNFAIPAALKAWIDLIARAGLTFQYTESGPKGLLSGKKAYVVTTSGGVPTGSPYDFATGYMKHVLGFIGISDVTFVSADQLVSKENESLAKAHAAIDAIAA